MTADPLVGRTLDGRYRLDHLIGRGGMGAVYEAEHVGLDKRVAVKVLSHLGDEDAIARFQREAKAAAKVSHPNVVQIFDVGRDDDGTDFLVMELFEGRDLRTALGDERLDASRAIGIAHQVLDGLDAIHRAGLIHRDIKPANILLATRDGEDVVKLTDFGIAKSAHDPHEAITEVGKVVGTLQYMAPEQLMGGEVDQRADIYAVGLTLYAMLAGALPFDTQTTNTIVATHMAGSLPRLAEKRPDLPRPLVAAVTRALATSPSARFADASGFAAALEHESAGPTSQTVADRPSRPRPVTDAAPKRPIKRIIAPIAIGFAVLVVAVPLIGALLTKPKPAALPAPPDARPPVSAIARAHQAEDAGDLELAIAQYQVAYADNAEPSYLYRIAELDERLGRPDDAARFFQKYLDASPKASDRELVLARIERLKPKVEDDGAAGSDVVSPFPAEPATPKVDRRPVEHCICNRTKPGRQNQSGGLCRKLSTPLCKCYYINTGVCPQPFAVVDHAMTCQPDDDLRNEFHLKGKQGAPCKGYDAHDNQLVTGAYVCNSCRDEDRAFVGHAGDPCTGFDPETEEKLPGAMMNCAP